MMAGNRGKGRPMVEVRDLKSGEDEPKGGTWVCIERRGDQYFLAGRADGKIVDPHMSPDGFPTAEAAIHAAMAWAEYLAAPVIYVKDDK
jgi:hypothetical protein